MASEDGEAVLFEAVLASVAARSAAGGVAVNTNHEWHLQAAIEEELRLRGWRFYHSHDSRRSVAGFPDLVCLRGDRVLVAEIKGPKTRVTVEQRAWLDAFKAAGVEAYLWRFPGDWANVERVLR